MNAETQVTERRNDLQRIATGEVAPDEFNNDELLRLGIGYGIPGPLSDEQVRREAAEILAAAVERTRCDSCSRYWSADELTEPQRLSERVDPDGAAPAGECPACGALAYPLDPNEDLVCRTMGTNLHMKRCEFEALLAHLKEGPPSVMRRQLEVLTGEKTLEEVNADEARERSGEPAYTVVGTYGDDQVYITTVYTFEGAQAAAAIAENACAEDAETVASELPNWRALAVFEGAPHVAGRADEDTNF